MMPELPTLLKLPSIMQGTTNQQNNNEPIILENFLRDKQGGVNHPNIDEVKQEPGEEYLKKE